jgi:S-DNA-T family DNA segregation ATPase FtsK/SpoIIIE
MARKTRRRGSPASIPDIMTLARFVFRPETVGALLVVAAAATIPYLLPLAGVIGDLRDSLVRLFGLNIFSFVVVLAGAGVLLALRRQDWARRHVRHLVGFAAAIVFVAGLLGRWHPDTVVGSVDLAEVSAGGDSGAGLAAGLTGTLIWLMTLPLAYALLWPRTALAAFRASPGASWAALQWTWELGLHRRAWHGLRAVSQLLLGMNRRGTHADTDFEPIVASQPPGAADGGLEVTTFRDEPPVDRAAAEAKLDAAIEAIAGPASPNLAAAVQVGTPLDEEDESPATQIPMDMDTPASQWRSSAAGWQLPPLSILTATAARTGGKADNEVRAQLIVDTLASFGVDASVVQINEGPAVTQFGVEPGWDIKTKLVTERDASGKPILDSKGNPKTKEVEVSRTRIRVNRITALQNDLALALAAPALRIEAPVPGKPMVGIEVPNLTTSMVSMRGVMETDIYKKQAKRSALPIALGQGVSGDPVVADLATMPHLLIAGATGSGKSVCLNSIITGLIMNYSPAELRLVMIDPKRVELASFGEIPHLAFSEIVVDMDRVVGTLQAVINEMETRYRRFAKAGVRNISAYNKKASNRKLPYWVVVIDELADLMLAAPYQVEHQLVRLAQLARATGIHLVVATQRPSVDVITGLIKANFPTRIAFAVSSQVDSRTILDQAGADKLLGRGDMLYVPPDAQKPKRVQGVYVSDPEIASVVNFWTADRFAELAPEKFDAELERAMYEAETLGLDGQPAPEGGDEMLEQAIELARGQRTLSTSMLQRKLGIGYPRAARIMDQLEERGVISEADGGKSRTVLLDADGEPSGGVTEEPASLAAHAAAVPIAVADPEPEAPAEPAEPDTERASRPSFPRPFDQ